MDLNPTGYYYQQSKRLVNKTTLESFYSKTVRVVWALLFFTLPVTSFPYFPSDFGGRTLVRPLSVYPLVILVFLVTLPGLLKRRLPKTFLPLLAFAIVASISSVIAFSDDLGVFRGVTLTSRFIRNMVTLGIGVSFYFTVTLLPKNWDDLKFSLRWLYAGFGIALLWGTFQIPYIIHFSPKYFKLANLAQSLISSRKLFNTRISGMTYEPKWFAEQICFLLLPWLLGSVLTGRTIFKWRYKWITMEWLLLVWSTIVMIFTFSRTGIIILGAMIFLVYLLFLSISQKDSSSEKKPLRIMGIRILEAFGIIAILGIVIYLVGSQNTYFSRFWLYWTERKSGRERTYLEYISFQQRFLYWETAYKIFEYNPILGVGLGNYAFYFDDMLPNQPYDLQKEIIRQITPEPGRDRLITPKNLLARLISETGLIGTGLFLAHILSIIGCIVYLWLSQERVLKYWGICGILSMFVFGFIIFSFDSFALPNMWVVFGLITAAAHLPTNSSPISISTTQKTRVLDANQ